MLLAAPSAGFMRDFHRTYALAFLTLAGLNFLGGVRFLLAKRPVPTAAAQKS